MNTNQVIRIELSLIIQACILLLIHSKKFSDEFWKSRNKNLLLYSFQTQNLARISRNFYYFKDPKWDPFSIVNGVRE